MKGRCRHFGGVSRSAVESHLVGGIDEVGRGALAGPVVAAAVVLDWKNACIPGLADSKRLTRQCREQLSARIMSDARAWSIGRAEASEIDRLNVLEASMLAMKRAFDGLATKPVRVRVDGNRYPAIAWPGEAIVRGDATVPEIMAASILAKVMRDREMAILDVLYPGYAFSAHKGYPTAGHRASLGERGPCPIHRTGFRPVRICLSPNGGCMGGS